MGEGFLRNWTFDDLQVGDAASLVRIVGRDDIDLFAAVSGDANPAHLDATFAATDLFGHIVAHGMRTAALVSAGRARHQVGWPRRDPSRLGFEIPQASCPW